MRTTTITATAGEVIRREAMVSVMQSAGSVVVSPAADTVDAGRHGAAGGGGVRRERAPG